MKDFNPEINREVNIGSKKYLVNNKYYLKNFSGWDEQIRDWLAEKEKFTLILEHISCISRKWFLPQAMHRSQTEFFYVQNC